MFASIVSGALISLVLFYLAPLPLMVASIGWGPLCASLGGIAAAIGLGALFGLPYCIAFAVTVALPAWWLGHLVLLGRRVGPVAPEATTEPPAEPELEWYPVGRILLWIAGFAALTTIAALLTLGTDAETITGTLRRGLMRLLRTADPQTSRRSRSVRRRAGADRSGRRHHRRDDDAHPQSLAQRQDNGDIGPPAASVAGHDDGRAAADDAGGALHRARVLLHRRVARDGRADHRRRR